MLAESNLRKLSKYNPRITLDLRNMLAGMDSNMVLYTSIQSN